MKKQTSNGRRLKKCDQNKQDNTMINRQKNTGLWILKLIASVIMLQTLYFKFTAAPESIYIFSTLGMEPWGRLGTGALELLASALILIPATTAFGAALGIGLMSGALFFHLTKLGIAVQDDGGLLFTYALAVWICCVIVAYARKEQLLRLLKRKKLTA
ncbi:MAG: DoxX family protein [Sediminibacterium sp.]